MSACVGHIAQLFGSALFWLFLRGCSWMRFAFELVVLWVKQIALGNVGEPQPISWKPKAGRGWGEGGEAGPHQSGKKFSRKLPLTSSATVFVLGTTADYLWPNQHSFLSLQPAIPTIRFQTCQTSTFKWANCLNKSLEWFMYISVYKHILLVVSLEKLYSIIIYNYNRLWAIIYCNYKI